MNETVKNRRIRKIYWAITENRPSPESGSLRHFLVRDGRTNRTKAYDRPVPDAKEARLDYRLLAESDRYRLLEIELLTGRHHQIRAQLSKIGCPIRGDLKYGAPRSATAASRCMPARSSSSIRSAAVRSSSRRRYRRRITCGNISNRPPGSNSPPASEETACKVLPGHASETEYSGACRATERR